MQKTVFIAEDHAIFSQGLALVIEKMPGFEVVGFGTDGAEVVKITRKLKPDIVFLDIHMPVMNGLDVCKTLVKRDPPPFIIVLTYHTDTWFFEKMYDLGVKGYLTKDCTDEEISTCLQAVSSGSTYFASPFDKVMPDANKNAAEDEVSAVYRLTDTERKILDYVSEGKTTQEIADTLHRSFFTIKNYRNSICKKLGIEGGTNALLTFAKDYRHLLSQKFEGGH